MNTFPFENMNFLMKFYKDRPSCGLFEPLVVNIVGVVVIAPIDTFGLRKIGTTIATANNPSRTAAITTVIITNS